MSLTQNSDNFIVRHLLPIYQMSCLRSVNGNIHCSQSQAKTCSDLVLFVCLLLRISAVSNDQAGGHERSFQCLSKELFPSVTFFYSFIGAEKGK